MRHLNAFAVAACLVLGSMPGTARAALDVDLQSTLNLEAGYTSILTNDPATPHVKDVTTREGVTNRLTMAGSYASVVLGYRINAVQLLDHSNLNYMEHRVGIDMDLDGLVSRFTHSGKLDVTAQVSVDPSLPKLGSGPAFTPYDESDPDTATRERIIEERMLADGDMLLIQEDRSGYAMHFGLSFSDEAGRTGRYNIGVSLRDHRYDSALIVDKSILGLSAGYMRGFLLSEAGLQLGHQRYLRGEGDPERTLSSASLMFARNGFRLGWRLGAGGSYTDQDETVHPTLSSNIYYRGSRVAMDVGARTGISDSDVDVIGFYRTRAANVEFHPARPTRTPWSISGYWSGFLDNDQYTGRVSQRVIWNDAVSGGISYARSESLIRDPGFGVDRRSSDTVLLSFVWRFI